MAQKTTYKELEKRNQELEQVEFRHKQVTKDLQHQSEMHEILMNISSKYSNVQLNDVENIIYETLGEIGEFICADRAYVFEYDFKKNIALNICKWCNKGIEPKINILQDNPLDTLSGWIESHLKGEPVIIPDVLTLPSGNMQDILKQQQIKSLIAIPMFHGDRLVGFTGFDSIKKPRAYPQKIIELINFFTRALINLMMRALAEDALHESEVKNRALQEATFEALFFSDKGFCIEANNSASKMFGYKHEDFIGIFGADIIADEFKDIVKEKMISGYEKPYEAIAQKKDGSKFWAEFHGKMFDYRGKRIRVTSVREITERKLAEMALQQERENLSKILESNPHGIAMTDNKGQYIYINSNFTKITGYTLKDIPSKKEWFEKAYPDTEDRKKASEKWIRDNLKQCSDENREFKIRCRNGQSKHLEFRSTFLKDQTISVLTDVTQRRKAEEALRKSEQRLSIHLQNTPVGAILWDLEFKAIEWNPAAESIFGYTRQEAIGKNITKLILPGTAKGIVEGIFQDLLSGRGGERSIKKNFTKTGKQILCEWYNTTLKNVEGVVTGVASLVNDITDRKRTEELMIQSEKMMSIGGLAAGMAHEINNPLAGMMQNSQVIRNRLTKNLSANDIVAKELGTSMTAIRKFMEKRDVLNRLESINQAGSHAAKIIKNMLSFARKSDSVRNKYDLVDLVDKTIEIAQNDYNLKKKYDFKQIEIIREYSPDLPAVLCDGSKIQQVIFNLLKNASESMGMEEQDNKTPKLILRLQKKVAMSPGSTHHRR